jgi:hypothetical protein
VLVEAGTGPEFYGLPDPKGKSYYHFLEIKAMFMKNNIRPRRCIFEASGSTGPSGLPPSRVSGIAGRGKQPNSM